MGRKKRKSKKNHVIIVTSDAVDSEVSQFRIRPWLFRLLTIILCALIGIAIGSLYYIRDIQGIPMEADEAQDDTRDHMIAQLEDQSKELEAEVLDLSSKISILSETVNQKTELADELTMLLEQQSIPTGFPLTGSATMEEITEGEPICIFNATVGITAVAAASGIVIAVTEDFEYGNNVWVDHGNGYVTIYRNQGTVYVKIGDTVAMGTTLFLIGEDNTKLGYQMMKDGDYMNPTDMLTISG